MAYPPNPQAQTILNGMLRIIHRLASSPDTDGERMEEYLAQISQLPAIKSVLDEPDSETDGRESEMYIYFKGVAILMRALIEKVGEEEEAKRFVNGVGEIQQKIFPAGEAKELLSDFEQIEKASEPTARRFLQPFAGRIPLEPPIGSLLPGCDGLPRINQSQLDEEITRLEAISPLTVQNSNSTAPGDSNELIVTGVRSLKRKLMLDDELIPPQYNQRPHSDVLAGYLRNLTTSAQDPNNPTQHQTLSSPQQANTEAWLTWRLVKDAAMAHPALIPAPLLQEHQPSAGSRKLRKKIGKEVSDAVNLLTQLLGQEGREQIRALEYEYLHVPQGTPTMPWPSLFKAPVAGSFRSLALCLRHFSGRKTALDRFGENLAQAELYRIAAGMGLSLPSVESVRSSDGGEQLYTLSCAFGIGILALVPGHLQCLLQYIRPDALKHVIASIQTSKARGLYEKIQNVSWSARCMMLAAVEGTSLDFRRAVADVVDRLEKLY
ncbi:hypothetical protein G7Y79_00078g099930 [Physcia stellaris]|nr:hypothetical protein G7Y79_00078g099930 [Physcia stellaris]